MSKLAEPHDVAESYRCGSQGHQEAGCAPPQTTNPGGEIWALRWSAHDAPQVPPGVPGVGHKKAVALIERFGDLTAILNAAADGLMQDNVKLRDKLLDHVDLARRCKLLASVKTDATIEELPRSRNEDDAHAAMLDLGMMSLCESAEFRRMMEIGV